MVCEQWNVPATAADVSTMRRTVVDFAQAHDVPDPPIAGLRLALAEAMSNAVMHAYEPGKPGTITVRLQIDGRARRVTLAVADDGGGLAYSEDPGAGYGLALMMANADTLDIRPKSDGRGTELTVSFDFATTT